MPQQLSLRVNLHDDATFENFLPADNAQLCEVLTGLFAPNAPEHLYYLWGKAGSGRSHLLQACCHLAEQNELSAVYLPLRELKDLSVELLQDLEHSRLLCLDDVDAVAGIPAWEEGLFHLYNRLLISGTRLVVSAACAPRELALGLADLQSRLSACVIFHLNELSDIDKVSALQLRAKSRGLQLPEAVGEYLLRHCPRDMHSLFYTLDQLLTKSLATQKKLSLQLASSVVSSQMD